jgi:hypothetical protein
MQIKKQGFLMRIWFYLVFLLAAAAPAQAEWRKAVTPHFEIYSEGSERALSDFAAKAERVDAVMRRILGVTDQSTGSRLKIYMLATQGEVELLYGRANVAGYYRAEAAGSYAVSNRETRFIGKQNMADIVLFHEYAHHFMMRYVTASYPGWFIEGFAEFYSTISFDKDGKATVGAPPNSRGYSLLVSTPVKIEALLGERPTSLKGEAVGSYYGRAWLLTHHLFLSGDRKGQLVAYLKAVQSGTPSLDAARAAFGDLAKLDDDLDRYLKQPRLNAMTINTPIAKTTDIKITTLSPEDGAFIKLSLKSDRQGPEKRLAQMAALKAQLVKYPASVPGLVMLAETHYEDDAFDAAIVAADLALKASPTANRAMLVKGQAMIRKLMRKPIATAAEWKEARSWIIKANRADADDPLPLFAYYQSWEQQGLEIPASAREGMAQAFRQAPEDKNLRMSYARSLVEQMKYSRALPLIESVVNDPHSSDTPASMTRLIAALRTATDGQPLRGRGEGSDGGLPTF